MSDAENMVVPMLQRIQTQLNAMDRKLDTLIDDVQMLKVRTTALEEAVVGLNRRFDNLDVRVSRIERRLDLTEA